MFCNYHRQNNENSRRKETKPANLSVHEIQYPLKRKPFTKNAHRANDIFCLLQDEEVSRILEEKQRLIAEILQERVQNLYFTPSGASGGHFDY